MNLSRRDRVSPMHMKRSGFLPGLVLVALLAGCGSEAASVPAVASTGAPGGSATAIADPGFVADAGTLRGDLEALQSIADANGGIRAAGTPGYEASVDHVAQRLREIGFAVETPSVDFVGFRELPGSRLQVESETFTGPDELHALIYSASGDVRGPVSVLEASGCDPEDFASVPDGAIALTTGGGCYRRDQALNAQEAGAAALLVGYPDRGPGEIYRPTLIDPTTIEIPVVSVTGDAVRALTEAAGQDASLVVETVREPSTLRNVIAQVGDGPSVLMLGAHLDSVFDGPGINDNGSGVAALLEVARGIVERGLPDGSAVRIAMWGGEELGDIGSRAYVAGLDDTVSAYLNLDMAGSPNGGTFVYDEEQAAPGSEQLTEAFEVWLAARGELSERIDLGGSSDHFPFMLAGIPTGGLFAGAGESGSAAQPGAGGTPGEPADACYHLACDDIGNVDLGRTALFAEATLAVTLQLLGSR